jgi:hypothetical protein
VKSFIQGGVTKSPMDKGMVLTPLSDSEIEKILKKAAIKPDKSKKGKLRRAKI